MLVSLLIILTTGGVLGILSLEGAVRLFWPQRQYQDWVQPDARYGHIYQKNAHFRYPFPHSDYVMDLKTNSLGFRDDEPAPYTPGIKTVMFLGDSYTAGFAADLEERFDKKLAKLSKDGGRVFRFVNAGIDGWGTVQETRYAEDHFDSIRPDIIVLTFCENDPFDDASFLASERPTPVEQRATRLFLHAHSHLYRFVNVLRWKWTHRDEVRQLGMIQKPNENDDLAVSIQIPEDLWAQSLQRIRGFHAAFMKVNPNGVLLVQATSPTSPDIRNHLSTLTNGQNLFYIDLNDAVSAIPIVERRLPHDPHWGSKVQDVSARALYDFIVNKFADKSP